ncbi:hypothetical protein [Streptomyces sp. NPDC127190]|uniref:hypothetical protein n=1 Tax=unclassified Streptomyces TaxID=2593676 RepID=UPI0036379029
MTPIRGESSGTETATATAVEGEPEPAALTDGWIRRGRHRKPRPRKVLLAAGGLALVAGVLSLVRVTPESGVGAPGTAEAEPRLDPGTTARAPHSGTPSTATPTALPTAASVMGGHSLAPTPAASSTARTAPDVGAHPTKPGTTAVPTPGAPAPATPPPGTPTAPAPATSAPATAAPTPSTSHTPAPSPPQSTPEPGPGGVCLPVLGLCVDGLGAS